MCTASLEKGYYWTSAKTTPSPRKQVRFAMKLPLFSGNTQKECDNNGNTAATRERLYQDPIMAAAVRQPEWSGAPAPNTTNFNYGGGMRRVQSANASRPRGAVGATADTCNPLGIPQKSRSHSQEARSTRNVAYDAAPPPSEQLPIPQCKNTLLEIARRKSDHTDLRRMYDYATWNMYDRIVTARNKKRMSEFENTDDLSIGDEGEKDTSSSSSSKNTNKPSPIVTSATTSCNSSFTSSPNQAAIAKGSGGIIKTSGKIKTTANNKVQASTSTTSVSATTSTQAMSTTSAYQQQTTTTTTQNTNATHTSLHYKLRSFQKAFSSQDTDSSQGGTAATEFTSTESEYSLGSSSGCNSPATFPGFMMTSEFSSSKRTMSQGSEDDHFIFQLDM